MENRGAFSKALPFLKAGLTHGAVAGCIGSAILLTTLFVIVPILSEFTSLSEDLGFLVASLGWVCFLGVVPGSVLGALLGFLLAAVCYSSRERSAIRRHFSWISLGFGVLIAAPAVNIWYSIIIQAIFQSRLGIMWGFLPLIIPFTYFGSMYVSAKLQKITDQMAGDSV